jgi:hypothetical protein
MLKVYGFVLLMCATASLAGETWTEKSFEDFRDGTFLDAGSNAYVSAPVMGRLKKKTLTCT